MKKLLYLSILLATVACNAPTPKHESITIPSPQFTKRLNFSPDIFRVKGEQAVPQARGQVLYVPVYSTIPFGNKSMQYSLEGVLSVHNTDLKKSISLTQVLFFHNDGYLVKTYLQKPLVLLPLETKYYTVPEADSSGPGANFLVEWVCDTAACVPLIETVMFSFNKGQGVSFSNRGVVVRQE